MRFSRAKEATLGERRLLEDHVVELFFGLAFVSVPEVSNGHEVLVADVHGHLESVLGEVEGDLSDEVDGAQTPAWLEEQLPANSAAVKSWGCALKSMRSMRRFSRISEERYISERSSMVT